MSTLGQIVRLCRRPATTDDAEVRGIAATYELVESDGYRIAPGAFGADVERVRGGAVIPLLWQHRSADPPIGVVREIEETGEGLRFAASWLQTERAQEIRTGVAAGAVADVSIYADVLGVDRADPSTITHLRLSEVSVCTTGFGADPGAGIGRCSTFRPVRGDNEDSTLESWIRDQFAALTAPRK